VAALLVGWFGLAVVVLPCLSYVVDDVGKQGREGYNG